MGAHEEIVTLVIKHRVKPGHEAAYEQWLKKTVTAASRREGHLGVDIHRSRHEGLQVFTCVLRYCSTDVMQAWLDSAERRELVAEALPMLADGDQTEVTQGREFWFAPTTDNQAQPPRWKQAVVSFLVILPLSLIVPKLWLPVLTPHPFWSGYLGSNIVITATIVTLVVYAGMPAATRLFASWLSPSPSGNDHSK